MMLSWTLKFLSILQCTVVPSGLLFLFPLCHATVAILSLEKSIPGNEKEEKIVIIKSALLGELEQTYNNILL